ncbi:MAG: methylated-DNA--[protein]-cysteine S-methyltransferase [Clostridiales bacterium]|nr:methylated-DNA--[protein]-cysteine S-methyltransferase [Clostridiales bacterium]
MHCVIASPVGRLRIDADNCAITGVKRTAEALRPPHSPLLEECVRQLNAYFQGRLTGFDLPLRMAGTPFRMKVWNALRRIPYGETCSYGQLAAMIGQPKASRAVGGANHHNPISIIVPCHRVIGADGTLTGYGGGLDMKQWLLEHERKDHHA